MTVIIIPAIQFLCLTMTSTLLLIRKHIKGVSLEVSMRKGQIGAFSKIFFSPPLEARKNHRGFQPAQVENKTIIVQRERD